MREHKIPPDSLGAEKHASLHCSGIRAFGKETADDYAVIHQRAGDLKAWGFSTNRQMVKTTNLENLTQTNANFVNKVLSKSERGALTTYTGGSYHSINAAITGRDPNPAASTKTVVSGIESAFDKFNEHNPNNEPMTVMRGTRVPSGWKSTAACLASRLWPEVATVRMDIDAAECQRRLIVVRWHAPPMRNIRLVWVLLALGVGSLGDRVGARRGTCPHACP
ncbi:ADP-ribosyltransferase [Prescottella agglutinans]|uniref:ADP-ribosyltransferase n=1 Tax=Prescottella agglutinans TaxID=1644129 RepID=UPI0031453D19